MDLRIDRLQAGEGDRWRSIRLQALSEAPHAFSTTHAEASCWPVDRWEAQVREFATFVAVLDAGDVGVARGAVLSDSAERELISMWVAPTARRHGIGARLIDCVAAWAEATGAASLVLEVVADNRAALALYQRHGFRPVDRAASECAVAREIRLARPLLVAGENGVSVSGESCRRS